MRRPVLCGGAAEQPPQPSAPSEGSSALSRVRRLLSASLAGRGSSSRSEQRRVFGSRLEELAGRQDARDGVPYAVVRLCTYIQQHGVEHEGVFRTAANQKLVEKLRAAFDRSGDAELETSADVHVAAALLKLFLRELPEPAVTEAATQDMLHAVTGSQEGCGPELRKVVAGMPEANRRLLHYLVSFLHALTRRESPAVLAAALGPSLFRQRGAAQQSACNRLVAALLAEFYTVFPDSMHAELQSSETPETPAQPHHRKRKERHESAGSSQIPQDRKVIRSNSQERPCEGSQEPEGSDGTQKSSPSASHTPEQGAADTPVLPLHEHNSAEATAPMEEEEMEHERRRSSERFASFPRAATPRSSGGNRRYHQPRRTRRGADSKENTALHEQHLLHHQHRRGAEEPAPPGPENISHPFLQLHPQEECDSRERSPSPATPRAAPPLLDLSTLHQQVDCSEPLTSQAPHHRVPWIMSKEDSHGVLLSPRNSLILTRRLDPNVAPSPPEQHVSRRREEEAGGGRARQLAKHISGLKKKIKVYEEQFEQQNGYRPSHADKLANRELKKMFSELNRLRKELKQVKEDLASTTPSSSSAAAPLIKSVSVESEDTSPEEQSLADTMFDVERRLHEKREEAGRPAELEELSREQLLAEKVALQKALLHLESLHGRPASRTDRDLVRPLYDRYRSLKRLVVRSGGSKLRDSMSELATILEHEAMDFSTAPETPVDTADAAGTAELPEASAAEEPDVSENLHALPLSELLVRQQEAREEKKRLRRALREFEEEFQRDSGRRLQREDREPRQQDYTTYKKTKARLRLLDALLAKHAQAPRSC